MHHVVVDRKMNDVVEKPEQERQIRCHGIVKHPPLDIVKPFEANLLRKSSVLHGLTQSRSCTDLRRNRDKIQPFLNQLIIDDEKWTF